jgi:hypothetical protein
MACGNAGRERAVMHWFRTNIRLGARLALLALAVQVVLSFGHVHFYGVGFAAAKAALAATVPESGPAAPGKPAPIHKSDGPAGLDCTICSLIQSLAHAAPAPTPELPLVTNARSGALHISHASTLAASPHFLFQARAPPTN